MRSIRRNIYSELRTHAAIILGLAAFTWSVVIDLGIIDAAFRGLVVYFGVSILMLTASRAISKMRTLTEEEEEEADKIAAEKLEEQSESEENESTKSENQSEPEPVAGVNG